MGNSIDKKVVLSVELDSSKAEQGFRRVAQAGSEVGNQVSSSWASAQPQLQRVNQQLLDMGLRFQQTGLISSRALASVGVNLRALTDEYGKTASATDKLTKSEREFLTTAQGAYKEAIQRQRDYNEQLQQVNTQTRNWTSLQGALEGMPGKFGQIAQAVGGVTAAFASGWAVGKKLDTWLEENISGWKKWRDRVAESIVGAQHDLTRLTDDPRFAGTRTEQLLPQIVAQMAYGKQKYEASLKESVDFGSELMKDYYQHSLQMQHEAQEKALKSQQDAIDRSNKLFKNATSFAGFRESFGIDTAVWGEARASEMVQQIISASEKATTVELELKRKGQEQIDAESLERWRRGMEEIGQDFVDLFRNTIPQALLQASITGDWTAAGAKIGEGILNTVGKQGGLGDTLIDALLGIQKTADGKYSFKGGAAGTREQALGQATAIYADYLSAFGGALSGWSSGKQAADLYYQQYQKLMPFVQRMTQAQMAGLMGLVTGGPYAAMAAHLFAAISSRIENAKIKSTWPYALPGISPSGTAFLSGNIDPDHFKNISAAKQKEVLADIQDSFDKFYDGYYRILLKFPTLILPNILKGITGLETGFLKEASAEYFQELQMWIQGTMPRDIAARFFDSLSEGFQSVGMSSSRFKSIWDKLQILDPEKALRLLGDLADGLVNLSESWQFLTSAGGSFLRPMGGSMLAQAQAEHAQSFADKLAATEPKILRLAQIWNTLTGEDQIAATKELGQALVDRVKTIKEAFQELAQSLDSVNRSIQQQIDQYKTAGMTPVQQIAFWQGKIAQGRIDLSHARNLQQAEQIEGDIQDWIDRVVSAGGSTSKWLEWGQQQLGTLQQQYAHTIQRFTDQITAENNAFIARFGPSYDAFLTGLDNAGSSADDLTTGLNNTKNHLDDFNAALDVARDNLLQFPTGGSTSASASASLKSATSRHELYVYVNDKPAAGYDLTDGFTRRTIAARGRR